MTKPEENNFSFNFKLPSEGLSLRAVAIEDDKPMLIFDAANCISLPTITEEDVACVVRLVMENKRPEFFYIPIPPSHPFFSRQYKQYSPQWLRGTSIGELLSETDWTMKCLNIGTRSNKSRTKFWDWETTSNLDGLGTVLDFPKEAPPGSIKMSCKSVEIATSNNQLEFIGEPKMKIDNQAQPMYSKYITEIYDSVAYHDEPLFLKMQELIKLILAVEWLQKQGTTFHNEWMMGHTKKPRKAPSQAIEIKKPHDDFIKQIVSQLPPNEKIDLGPVSIETDLTKCTKTGFEIKVTHSSSILPMKGVWTVRASVNDYDMLYDGFDPNEPLGIDNQNKPIVPDVGSWSELFSETVPWPLIWEFPNDDIGIPMTSGGVTTNNIPVVETSKTTSKTKLKTEVKEEQYCHSNEKLVTVRAARGKKQEPIKLTEDQIPKRKYHNSPTSDVRVETPEAKSNRRRKDIKVSYGYEDMSGSQTHTDSEVKEVQALNQAVRFETIVNGQKTLELRLFGHTPCPTKTISTKDQRNKSGEQEKPSTAQPPLPPDQDQILQQRNPLLSPTPSDISTDSGFSSLPDEPNVKDPSQEEKDTKKDKEDGYSSD